MNISFDDNTRMQRLLSELEGEAKRSFEAVGHNGIFYATPLIVPHLKIQFVLDLPQMKPNEKIGLRHYHQQVEITNTWLLSDYYKNPIISYENFVRGSWASTQLS